MAVKLYENISEDLRRSLERLAANHHNWQALVNYVKELKEDCIRQIARSTGEATPWLQGNLQVLTVFEKIFKQSESGFME